jgi:hypothetical protein
LDFDSCAFGCSSLSFLGFQHIQRSDSHTFDIIYAFQAIRTKLTSDPLTVTMSNSGSVAPLDLTAEEQQKINELKLLLQPILTGKESPGFNEAAKHADDGTLLRFLQARPTVADAAAMFTTSMEWRENVKGWNDDTNGVDAIYDACENPSGDERVKKALSVFWGLCVTEELNHQGGPILYEKIGAADVAGIAKHPTMMEDMERCYVFCIEKAFRFVRKRGRCRAQVLVDLQGLSSSLVRHTSVMTRIAKIGTSNYPEVTQQVAMVRGPWIVRTIWSVISPVLPPDTKAKVAILGKDFKASLTKLVPEKCIPGEWIGDEEKEDGTFLVEFMSNRAMKV